MAVFQSNPKLGFKLSDSRMPIHILPSLSLGFQSSFKTNPHCLTLSLRNPLVPNRKFFLFAASQDESKPLDIGIEEESKVRAEESHIAWEQTFAYFKEQSIKLQTLSKEYSKQAMIILQETSEKLKIQAEKARQDLSVIAEEISEESKEHLATAAVNSPEPVKDIVETFMSSKKELYDVSEVRDFYIGIPYGALLSIGGFLSFMFTGSIPAIRFGIILGGSLLALSTSSLRSWKKGDSSLLVLKGQAAIVTILFLRDLRLLSMRPFITNFFATIVSGGVVAFYIYRIVRERQSRGSSLEA